MIAICAVISGAETWVDIADFGQDEEAWLREFLDLENGIPSHDTFARVFQLLDPQRVQDCYQEWIRSVSEVLEGDVIAIDGKTMRRTHDRLAGKSAVHMLHAMSVASGLVVGQRTVGEKTNEIPEIPQLLRLLRLKGCIVTLDAMGAQTAIVQAIVEEHEADYVIALKANQGSLYKAVVRMFDFADQRHPRLLGDYSHDQQIEKPRGIVERRTCEVLHGIDILHEFRKLNGWVGLQSIARIRYEQKVDDQWVLTDTRYFISSLPNDAHQILRCVRTHWHVENKLHRVLDVTFRQDDTRIRVGNSPENFAVLQHVSLNLLKKDNTPLSLRRKRIKAARKPAFRRKILTAFDA